MTANIDWCIKSKDLFCHYPSRLMWHFVNEMKGRKNNDKKGKR